MIPLTSALQSTMHRGVSLSALAWHINAAQPPDSLCWKSTCIVEAEAALPQVRPELWIQAHGLIKFLHRRRHIASPEAAHASLQHASFQPLSMDIRSETNSICL